MILTFVKVEYEDLQRKKLKDVIEEMTEENKQIDKLKIKDKEKIKKLEGLLQRVHQQVEPLVNTTMTFWKQCPELYILDIHLAGTSVNSVNYAPCLLHYNVSQWEFQISHCFNSTIIFIQDILL